MRAIVNLLNQPMKINYIAKSFNWFSIFFYSTLYLSKQNGYLLRSDGNYIIEIMKTRLGVIHNQ